ncbi:MAG: NADH-quinone oxidoreductase subunit NuoE [bacterium]
MKTITEATRQQAQALIDRYPTREAAMLPILHLVQQEFGYLDEEAELAVAALMEVSPVFVREAATFYFMYHRHPVGRYHLQVCHNISCTLMGAETILAHIEKTLGIKEGERTADGLFSLEEVECIACSDRAPALLVNDQLHVQVTPEKLDQLTVELRSAEAK